MTKIFILTSSLLFLSLSQDVLSVKNISDPCSGCDQSDCDDDSCANGYCTATCGCCPNDKKLKVK